jgi:endoglucanase
MRKLITAKLAVALCVWLTIGCSGGGGGSAGASPPPPSPPPPPATIGDGPFIVVDQFGYLPEQEKVAVIRDPSSGFDANDAFAPGQTYQVIDTRSNASVLQGAPTAWNNGAIDPSSGDRAWRFDFSAVVAPGDYEILDVARNVRSARFSIGETIYRPILTQAVRTFFYQRAGFAKEARFAGAAWADGASHLGALQDSQARLYSSPNDAGSQRDLHGGWYDAGDYNKYTNWTAEYVVGLLHAYFERPQIWTDDTNIPESGNGVPDLLDEIKWGLDWLVRMQNADGSVLSIVGLSHASPPSSASGPSLYGSANTSATLSTAAAFALGAEVYGADGRFGAYAADLRARAAAAWAWALANPNVIFRNNDETAGTQGLGAGQQEVDDYGRAMKRIIAAIYLYDLTGEATYRTYVDAHYREAHLFAYPWVSPFEAFIQRPLLHYASLPGASPSAADAIKQAFVSGFNGADGWGAMSSQRNPYLAFITDYTWGSNSTTARQGAMFVDYAMYNLGTQGSAAAMNAGSHYLHYLHGVNPLGKVYLSNMAGFGAENSVDQFFHSWFADGSARWDSVRASTYGPAPGFLVGGPNPHYNWESRCPGVNPACGSAPPSPPFGQPAQKSYVDFNTSWPLNSWEVTENSDGYQTDYIRLLSKYVR